jgi:mRNA interferase MazF
LTLSHRKFEGKTGQIVLDQLRTVDKKRLVKRLGEITQETRKQILETLAEMFAE